MLGVCLATGSAAQRGGADRVIVDDGHKFVYTDSAGVTSSYIMAFGDSVSFPPLLGPDGSPFDLDRLRGKPVVINFWFTACKPCVAEMPVLNRLVAAHRGDSVVFLGVTWDKKEKIDAFLSGRPFDFMIARLPMDDIQKWKKVALFPLTMMVDRRGHIRFVIFGRPARDNDDDAFYGLLERQLKQVL